LKAFFLIFLIFCAVKAAIEPQHLIIPAALITTGAIISGEPSKNFEQKIEDYRGRPYRFDDFLQYLPHISLYGLSLTGVDAKNSYHDRTLLLGTSFFFVGTSVLSVKYITDIERPDKSNRRSFPSAHTAIAFQGAELIRREYPFWCGAISYTMASGIGAMRIYNKKHWLSDVVAGAGFGILSANAAYWLLPVQQRFFDKIFKKENSAILYPQFDGENLGLSFVFLLK
jgi:membrane-associated phospholipid phosphatase